MRITHLYERRVRSLRAWSLASAIGGSCLLLAGCSSTSKTVAGGCEALEVRDCECDDGTQGTRTCDATGERFGACDCSASSGGSGGTAGSAGNSAGGSGATNGGSTSGGAGAGGSTSGGSTSGGAAGSGATSGSGGTAGAGGSISCPIGMAAIDNTFCMDRFELKEQLPTAPTSMSGVQPLTNYKPGTLKNNCKTAGKRLCSLEELALACSNGGTSIYPYGNMYTEAACGGSDVHLTGAVSSCQTADQVYDLVGNVWELAEFGSGSTATIFGGDHRQDGAARFSCCIRTTSGNAFPSGCEAFYDDADLDFHGANLSQVDVNAFTHTKDIYGRPIDLGYRCCADAAQ